MIHDFYDTYSYANLRGGVIAFAEESGATLIPIGDKLSILVVKMGDHS